MPFRGCSKRDDILGVSFRRRDGCKLLVPSATKHLKVLLPGSDKLKSSWQRLGKVGLFSIPTFYGALLVAHWRRAGADNRTNHYALANALPRLLYERAIVLS